MNEGTARIIDGKAVAARVSHRVADDVADLRDFHRVTPGLAVVLVGEDPASQVYVRMKKKKAADLGIKSLEHLLPASVTEEELITLIEGLNSDPDVNGILVQLPLPDHIDQAVVLNAIEPEKDVDGFHPVNAGRLAQGVDTMIPCTPQGCLILLKEVHESLSGLKAVVVGRSNIVGKPLANLLVQKTDGAAAAKAATAAPNATVTVCHSATEDLTAKTRAADIVVVAVGIPEFLDGSMITQGTAVIDVGVSTVERENGEHEQVGDVEVETVDPKASHLTPNPGGVGPMTRAMLMHNTIRAAGLRADVDPAVFPERVSS